MQASHIELEAVVTHIARHSDAALESSAVAAETSIVYRQTHWPVPPLLLNILPFKWAMLNRLTSHLTATTLSRISARALCSYPG